MNGKIYYILYIIILTISSCSNHFDPRLYNKGQKKKETNETAGEWIIPTKSQDPFLKTNEWWNNPNNAGFNSSVFNEWLISVKFGNKNIPEYVFLTNPEDNTNDSLWHLDSKNINLQLYTNRGMNTKADNGAIGIVTVIKVVYFKYKGLNTYFFNPDNSYNTEYPGFDKLSRFNFYRFTGVALIMKMDNCLIAVDKYSKLIFAYGKPTEWKEIIPNVFLPKKWGSIDNNTENGGKKYPFYEYDPIGYIKKGGEVVLFSWFKSNIADGNYDPRKSKIESDIANPVSGIEGRSPYAFKIET